MCSGLKQCCGCSKEKELDEFNRDKGKKDGRNSLCKECTKQYKQKYNAENRDKIKKYREENSEHYKELKHSWDIRNREHKAAYVRNRKQSDALFAFKERVRRLVRAALTRGEVGKNSSSFDYLGLDIETAFAVLGPIPAGYDIDHIVPISQAKTEEEVIALNHYTNLQYLPHSDNLKKSDKPTERGLELVKSLLGREWCYGV